MLSELFSKRSELSDSANQNLNALKQLKIYYLFMNADGEASPAEKSYLKEILTKSELSEESTQKFQTFCGQMALAGSIGMSKTITEKIDDILDEKGSESFLLPPFEKDKTLQAQTIWTLINLGYADSEYSEAEKQVVSHLIQRWHPDPVLIEEFNDTAETILALTLQKEWVQKTSRPYRDIHNMIQELDRSIASMLANVEESIAEAGIESLSHKEE